MTKIRKKFKEGAASFYIVAISTLILVIVAASFAAVIISEVTRTSNDDLAQSAYDAALAGVEDAKLAFYSYQSCLENNGSPIDASGLGCDKIKEWVEKGELDGYESCDMVSVILDRKRESGGVLVQESNVNNDMQQAYTCVKLSDATDYKTTLTAENPTKIMRAHFNDEEKDEDGKTAVERVESVVISWQRDTDASRVQYSNLNNAGIFGAETPLPPVISLGLVQTAKNFTLDSFDMTNEKNQTNRGTLYLVPTDETGLSKVDGKYEVASWNEETRINSIGEEGFLKSNDKTAENLPYAVRCADGGEYACTATIALPEPVDGGRNNDTFMFVLSMPYADGSTDVRLQFCDNPNSCYEVDEEVEGKTKMTSHEVPLDKVQIVIDSTGRANDLYRRVETRLEPADKAYPFPLYAIEVLGDSGSLIDKNISPTCEQNFIDTPNCE